MQPRPFLVLGLSLGLAAPAAAQGKRLELSDLQRLVNVADPALSPDGKTVACIVSRVNWSDDRFDQDLVLVDVATGAQRRLTFERKGLGSPQWSPGGDRLAFVATAGSGDKGAPQVFVLDMRGGEARKLTDAPGAGVEQFAWKLDGTEIAYVAADEPENKKDIEAHNDAFEVGDDGYLTTAAPTPSHIWLVSADGGAARRLTHGTWSLAKTQPPGPPSSPLSWSPDGKTLLFTEQATPHFGDAEQTRVRVLDVASGVTRALTGHTAFEGYAVFSPDGARVAYWYPRDGDLNNVNEIFVTATAGGAGASVTRALDRNLLRAIWMPDGKALLVGGHDGTRTALWLQPLDGTAAKRIELGDVSPSWSFWLDASIDRNGAIAFTGSSPGRPTELYYLATPGASPRRLTDLNGETASRQLGAVERLEWQGPDGYREDGVVTYPPGFTKGRAYPLVLLIHGGPTAASVRGFSFLSQLLAAHDYIVFSPNYRGSDNLGNAYQRAIFNDAGDGPGRDVMAGIATLAKLGGVDTTRIGVSGWSYGGYMTTWLTGHYRTWKAAVAGAAVTNLLDQYNMADYNVGQRFGFVGFTSPWTGQALQAYRAQSPISYVAAMKTPTLILSDVRDARVTVSQSYELYHALRDNGVPVKFVAYPVDGHFPADPVRTTDVYRRWLEWLDQYLKGPVSAR